MSGFATQGSGKFEKSIAEAEIGLRLNPGFTIGYANIAFSALYLGRVEEAEKALQRAAERRIELSDAIIIRYYLSFLRRDTAGMQRQVVASQGVSGTEDLITHSEALVLASHGRLPLAADLSRRAVDLAEHAGQHERASMFEAAPAVWNALYGNSAEAAHRATIVLAHSRGRDVQYAAAFAFAASGDSSQSEKLANDLAERFPEDTSVRFTYLPTLRALSALNNRDPRGALEQLRIAVPFDFAASGIAFNAFFGALYPAYVRGEAYLAARQFAAAAAEFQKILDHRGLVLADPIGTLGHLQLGRALALSGEMVKAKAAYQEFFALWNEADPAIPIFRQAQAEYAKLP